MGPLLDRDYTITEFAEWMLVDKSPDKIAFVRQMAEQTPSTVLSILNATACYDDYTETLSAMDSKLPLLYVVRKEWGEVVTSWADEHTPLAKVSATMDAHLSFWERSKTFNTELVRFLRYSK